MIGGEAVEAHPYPPPPRPARDGRRASATRRARPSPRRGRSGRRRKTSRPRWPPRSRRARRSPRASGCGGRPVPRSTPGRAPEGAGSTARSLNRKVSVPVGRSPPRSISFEFRTRVHLPGGTCENVARIGFGGAGQTALGAAVSGDASPFMALGGTYRPGRCRAARRCRLSRRPLSNTMESPPSVSIVAVASAFDAQEP
jgi:hypothetical protein